MEVLGVTQEGRAASTTEGTGIGMKGLYEDTGSPATISPWSEVSLILEIITLQSTYRTKISLLESEMGPETPTD